MAIIFDGTQGITTPAETANNSVTTPIVRSPSGLTLQTNGSTTAMTIDTSQNVGIGLTSPTSKLTVRTADGDGVSIQNAAGTAYRWAVNADNSFSCVNTGIAERMRLTSDGLFQFNSGYGSVATAYGVRAWINYNGTNNAIRASGGVSSITDRGTGNWDVNFSFSMPDANYSALGSRSYRGVTNFEGNAVNYARVYCAEVDVPYLFDPEFVYVAIVR